MAVGRDDVVLEIGRQVGHDAEPSIEIVDVVVGVRADARMVLHVAVALLAIDRKTYLEGVGQRDVDQEEPPPGGTDTRLTLTGRCYSLNNEDYSGDGTSG